MTGEENFDMGLFDSEDDLELNLDLTPEDLGLVPDGEGEEEEEIIDNNNPGEGEDSQDPDLETVAGDEDPEGDEDNSADDNADNTTSPSMYSSFANLLHEEGLLSSLDSNIEIKSISDINNLIKKEVELRVESNLSAEELEDLKAIRNGIPKEELANHRKLQNQLGSINESHIETNAELRKQLIYQDYINQGLSEAKSLKLLNRSIELEQDKEDAAEALGSIKQFEANKLEQQQEQYKIQKAQEEAEFASNQKKLKDSIYAKDEIIKGQKMTQTLKDRVFKSMTDVVGNTPDGIPENALMKARRESPIEFDSKLYYLYEITKGFSDFSILNKKATSNASSKLEEALRRSNFIQDSGMPSYLQDDDSYSGIGTELNL